MGTPELNDRSDLTNDVIGYSLKIHQSIIEKYSGRQFKCPPSIARQDALAWAAIQHAAHSIEDVVHPPDNPNTDPEEIKFRHQRLSSLQIAIEQARLGNWTIMKGVLSQEARLSMELSTMPRSTKLQQDDQKEGEAFANLASQLDT